MFIKYEILYEHQKIYEIFSFLKMTEELTKEEKEALKYLIKEELKRFKEQEKEMEELRPNLPFLAVEEKYEDVLEKLLKKLE